MIKVKLGNGNNSPIVPSSQKDGRYYVSATPEELTDFFRIYGDEKNGKWNIKDIQIEESNTPDEYDSSHLDIFSPDNYKWSLIKGEQGQDGASSYTYIAYANSDNGIKDFSISDSQRTHIGVLVTEEKIQPTSPSRYNWSLIKGIDGKDGIPGAKGEDGLTPYFHNAYANITRLYPSLMTNGYKYIEKVGDSIEVNISLKPDTIYIINIDKSEINDGKDAELEDVHISINNKLSGKFNVEEGTSIKTDETGIISLLISSEEFFKLIKKGMYKIWLDEVSDFSATDSNRNSLGTYTDYTKENSEDITDYTWTRISKNNDIVFEEGWSYPLYTNKANQYGGIELEVFGESKHYAEVDRGRNLFSYPGLEDGKVLTLPDYSGSSGGSGGYIPMRNSLLFDPSNKSNLNKVYYISFKARSPKGITELSIDNKNQNPRHFYFPITVLTEKLGKDWEEFVLPIKNIDKGSEFSDDYSNRIEVYARHMTGVQIKDFKVEESEPKPYTPAPEEINDNLLSVGDGGRLEVISSKGKRNLLNDSIIVPTHSNNVGVYPIETENINDEDGRFTRIKRTNLSSRPTDMSILSLIDINNVDSKIFDNEFTVFSFQARASEQCKFTLYGATRGSNIVRSKEHGSIVDITTQWNTYYVTFPKLDKNDVTGMIVSPLNVVTKHDLANFHLDLKNWKAESGQEPTDYIPSTKDMKVNVKEANYQKSIISISEPLRSVYGYRDRLYKDNSDGLWKVERNIAEQVVTNNTFIETFPYNINNAYQFNGSVAFAVNGPEGIDDSKPVISSHQYYTKYNNFNDKINGHNYVNSITAIKSDLKARTFVRIPESLIGAKEGDSADAMVAMFKNKFADKLTIQYVLKNPKTEVLDDVSQRNLNTIFSYRDNNYIYWGNEGRDYYGNSIGGIAKAKFLDSGTMGQKISEIGLGEKANLIDVEEEFNENASKLLTLQQEIEAAASASELDSFIAKYNEQMESINKDNQAASEGLNKALTSVDLIEKVMNEYSESWVFMDRFIKNTNEGIVIGNETTGSYILMNEERITFFSNGNPVAFIAQNLMEISSGAFVEEIRVSKYKFEETVPEHLTIRYLG